MTTIRDCASFVSGFGAGVALALLFAPRAGLEVRNEIREQVQRGAQALKDSKSAAEGALERELGGIGAAVDAGKRAYQDAARRGQESDAPATAV
jgi:hypothetical protein